MDQNTNNRDGSLRFRKPLKQESAIPSAGQGITNDNEGVLDLPFLIGSICLVLAVAAFLLPFLVSMSYGFNLFLNILFPLVSFIGVISIGFWWKKDDSKFMDYLPFLFSDNRVISFIILFIAFAFALSLILIAPIFVITPIITGNSLLFGIGSSLSDASVGVLASTIASSVGLFIAGLFLLYRTVKYFCVYTVSCTMTASFSRHSSKADLTTEQSQGLLVPEPKNARETINANSSPTDGRTGAVVAEIKKTLTLSPSGTRGERPPSRMVVGSAPESSDHSYLNSQSSAHDSLGYDGNQQLL